MRYVVRAGPAVRVAGIKRHLHPATVYNFVVEDTHTCFVGAAGGGLEVHNSCGPTSVYRSLNEAGDVQNVGITNDMVRRAAEHAGRFRIQEVVGGLSRADARAVEQALIEQHVLARNGGTLLNQINSIAGNNPIYSDAIQIGKDILSNIGY